MPRWRIYFTLLLGFARAAFAQDGSTASSLTIPPDARSLAMGGAYTAIAEGASSVWWNSGGLGLQHGIFVRPITYSQVASGVSDVWFYSGGVAGTVSGIGFALQYSDLSYGKYSQVDPNGSSERSLYLGAGVDVLRLFKFSESDGQNFAWGLGTAFKYVHVPRTLAGDIAIEGKASWDFDIGTLLMAKKHFDALGQNVTNYVGARLGVQWTSVFGREVEYPEFDQSDPLPQRLHVGLAMEGILGKRPSGNELLRALISYEREESRIEWSLPGINRYGMEISVGAEIDNVGLFAIPRFGYVDDHLNDIHDYSIGGGVQGRIALNTTSIGIGFDYANIPRRSDLDRIHRFTFAGSWSY